MSEQPYKRPPITEAVIELRFDTPIDAAVLDSASSDFNLDYPLHVPLRNVGFQLDVPPGAEDSPTARINQQENGHRRSSSDLSEIVLLWPGSFVVAQLAPYLGWDAFFERFTRDWIIWKKVTGYRKIIRVGVRFINRIDIPFTSRVIEESDYLNVYPKLPDVLGPVASYGIQAQVPITDIDCNLVINSASVRSPLLGHGSIALDLDIFRERNAPQRDEDIYNLLNIIRTKKNEIFEACITNKARELFRT